VKFYCKKPTYPVAPVKWPLQRSMCSSACLSFVDFDFMALQFHVNLIGIVYAVSLLNRYCQIGGVAIFSVGEGGCAYLSWWVPNDLHYYRVLFAISPNQASFSPRHEYAHVQTAMTNLISDSGSDLMKKRAFKLSAFLRMLILSSVLEWIHYSESQNLC